MSQAFSHIPARLVKTPYLGALHWSRGSLINSVEMTMKLTSTSWLYWKDLANSPIPLVPGWHSLAAFPWEQSLLLSLALSESFQQNWMTHLSRQWPAQAFCQIWGRAGQRTRERPAETLGLQPELDTQSAQLSGGRRQWILHVICASHPGGLFTSSCTEKEERGLVECQGQ